MVAKAENPQVATRLVSCIAVGLIACLIAAVGVLALSFSQTISRTEPAVAAFPEPALRTDERAQRLAIEKAQADRLAGKNGAVSIERAMDIIVARGSHAYDPITGPPQ
jgi:hypothetical protein